MFYYVPGRAWRAVFLGRGAILTSAFRDRFQILRDLQFYAPPVTNTAGVLTNGPSYPANDQEIDINIFIKLKGLATHYKSTSNPATIADISTGALYAAFVCNTTDSGWGFGGAFRLRYEDK